MSPLINNFYAGRTLYNHPFSFIFFKNSAYNFSCRSQVICNLFVRDFQNRLPLPSDTLIQIFQNSFVQSLEDDLADGVREHRRAPAAGRF